MAVGNSPNDIEIFIHGFNLIARRAHFMSQFKTEWMTGIFVDPGDVSQLVLANIENLRPVRIDKSQDEVLLSVTQIGGRSTPLLLAANQKNALASILFDDSDAWLDSEHVQMSFAEIKAHQEGTYRVDLKSADGLQSYALERFELIGNSVIASFRNKTVGADGYKISLGSVNTNASPLQQIHDPAKMLSDSRVTGFLRQSANHLADQHFVRPTRPALGHHYYRNPSQPRLYLNNSLSSALPFGDNASAGMQDVLATAAIFQNHDKLPGLSQLNPQPLHALTTTESGKIVLSVVFSAADTQLGLMAGATSLLKANPNNNPAKTFYLPPVPRRDAIHQTFVFKGFKGEVGETPEGLSASNTLWFSAKDDLIGILNQKKEQFSVDMPFDSRNSQSPSMRVASALGMRDFNNAYVATLAVDPRVVFRPKGAHNLEGVGGHNITNLEIGVPTDASGNVALVKDASNRYWINNIHWSESWDPLYKDTHQGFFDVETNAEGNIKGKTLYSKFSQFYSGWWNDMLQAPFENSQSGGINPIDAIPFAFPWTGIGYTFDYWDQVNVGSQTPTSKGRGPGEMVLLPNANYTQQEMTDKFGIGVNPWEYEVHNIQTINQFLKNSISPQDEFPGLDLIGGDSVELGVNIKRLGMNANTLYIYECDPITGKIWTGNMQNPEFSPSEISSHWLDPNSQAFQYQQAIVQQGSRGSSGAANFDVFKIDASDMPAYRGSADMSFKLNSTKNWGLLLQRPDGSFASSYDSASNPFVVMSDGVSLAYCVEDIRLDSPLCDFDFNDVIVTLEYV